MNVKLLYKHLIFTAGILLLFASLNIHHAPGEPNKQKIYVIPVSGDIDPGMAAFIKRSVRDLPADNDSVIVFEMDTFGGRVDSALEMVDTITGIHAKTIAYVKTKAISAGALISLACKSIVMKQNTTIGDCAPIAFSGEGPQVMGEKFQSPLRAKFRALAKLNGYPSVLAESMVTMEMEVYRIKMNGRISYIDSIGYKELDRNKKKKITSKKTIVKKGELLTMDNTEARDLGFSMFSVSNLDEMLEKMNIENYKIVRIEKNWSELLVTFLLMITPVLILIGMGAIYTEIKSPGFGIPGIIGIICLALAFGGQYVVGLADYTDLLVIAVGVLLVGLEILIIPGFGIAGILGFLFIIAGMILALQDFTLPDPDAPWEMSIMINNAVIVLGSLFASFFVMYFMLKHVITRLAPARGPYLNTTLKDSHADSSEAQKANVNDTGIAITHLRPSGKMKIDDNMFDVIAESEYIEKDTPVIITQIKGNRIVVSKKEE